MGRNSQEGGYRIKTYNGIEMPVPVRGEYLPTPEEIDRLCAEIRKEWSADERRMRRGNTNGPSTAKVFRIAMMRR